MPNCPRCYAFSDSGSAYCATCGRPRIVESLQVPVAQPSWQRRGLQVSIVVAAVWLLVTIGVAFLREAKAVRVSRELLAAGKAQEAWSLLGPFLADHPQHIQALFLGGQATLRLGLKDEAKNCFTEVRKRSPELADELGKDFRNVLTAQTRTQACGDASNFDQLLAWAEGLGDPYTTSVYEGLDGIVESCQSTYGGPSQFIAALAKREQAVKMAEKGYAPVIGRALAQARYGDAYRLSQQAVSLVPNGEKAVKEVLNGERRKVSATVESLNQLCDQLKVDARYSAGNSWCFPAAAPPAVQSARDGWGRAILYSPLSPDDAQHCHQGFALTSLGGDGTETEDDGQTPAAEIVCRFVSGWESRQAPHRYWFLSNDH
jgi:tetratricopeptide (TPR) repeat protein